MKSADALRTLADNPWAEYLPDVHAAMHAAADRIDELQAALRFYAKPKNWDDGDNSSPTDHDCGWLARRVLGEEK